jgi:hypothetical protein
MTIRTVATITLVFAFLQGFSASASTVFGLTDTGELFESSDGGATWSVVSTVPCSDAVAIAAGNTSDELFLATQSGDIYRSSDGGENWTAAGAVAASDIVDMAIRTNGDVFLLSRSGTVWRSEDDGASFEALATLTASNFVSMCGSAGSSDMYSLTETGEVSRSENYGVTWNVVGAIATSEAIDIRAYGTTLHVLTGSGDIMRSSDRGVSWLAVGTISQVHMSGLSTCDGRWIAVTREGLVASSVDAAEWSFVGSINQLNVVAIGNDNPSITRVSERPPSAVALRVHSLWPNPAGDEAGVVTVSFELPGAATVFVDAYNVRGQRVSRGAGLHYGDAGLHTLTWSTGYLPSGVYFLSLRTREGAATSATVSIVR